ncbi:hypothetical protein GGQ22_12370 [Nocardioides sp. zg-579]|uniref:Uncharacterized protein n=1 Tax=Nocardioides marmotae TaxID=2663857 RepID=A0A6I3JCR1_9ACTN|nr:hypothetical protein [Nocardioides marmotae]MTB95875.1 hypothetical protein [Nocardioides marmotae]QKE02777.1 hypothetical protein HPC71_18165 [Nocardioides marmotae]
MASGARSPLARSLVGSMVWSMVWTMVGSMVRSMVWSMTRSLGPALGLVLRLPPLLPAGAERGGARDQERHEADDAAEREPVAATAQDRQHRPDQHRERRTDDDPEPADLHQGRAVRRERDGQGEQT